MDVYVERDLPGKANHRLSKRCRIAKAQKVFAAASMDGSTADRETNGASPFTAARKTNAIHIRNGK
jgi:hypothetical protein